MIKPEVNIIYSSHQGAPSLHYEGEDGCVWISNSRNKEMHNITMSWYSLNKPHPDDSIWVIEPYCIHDVDYDLNFVKKFKYIFTWATKAFQQPELTSKLIKMHHPSCKGFPDKNIIEENWSKPWDQRTNDIVFIANNKQAKHPSNIYKLRVNLADELHKDPNFNVSWYGQSKLKKPYYKGPINTKDEILKKAKFTICTENSYDQIFSHNYFSEKMPEAWINGAVPIYMGCFNIDDFGFAPESYIDLRKFVTKNGENHNVDYKSLKETILNYNENNYKKTKESVLNNINDPKGLPYIISYDRFYKKLIKVLHQ